jgi:hypothetical protein
MPASPEAANLPVSALVALDFSLAKIQKPKSKVLGEALRSIDRTRP